MTQYSIHTKAFTNNSNSINSANNQDNDTKDWESKMANLVGLTEDFDSIDADNDDSHWEPLEAISQPVEPATKESLSANPFAKLSLVGIGTFSIILVAGGFLSQIMNGGHSTPKKVASPVTEERSPLQDQSENLNAEVESLKTKLALAEQTEAVKAAQQQLRNSQVNSNQKNEPIPAIKSSVQTVYVPRVVTVERLIKVPQIVSKPSPKIVYVPRIVTKTKIVQVPQTVSTSPATPPPPQQSTYIPSAISPNNVMPTPIAPSSSSVVSQKTPNVDKAIASGSSAKAVLATAVFGETTSSNNESNEDGKNVFVVRLQEPLKSADGSVIIPENTELLTEIRSLSEQGLLRLRATNVVLDNNGSPQEIDLPKNAIIIRAVEGKPLIANQYPDHENSITGMDAGLFILGGLGKAAELFNRTESQIVTTNAAGTIINNNNPQKNILAGVMEGGMNSMVPQISQRNQQAIAQMMQRTNIWFLPAGTEVEVYVNKSLQL